MTINVARALGLKKTVLKIDLSFRYFVIGGYKDRKYPMIRIYPSPFVRVTFGKLNGASYE
jgi:hypothetical protein